MARDKFHKIVRQILEEEGWTITHDPYQVKFGTKKKEREFGVDKLIAAEKGAEKIVVEINHFLSNSTFDELHHAIGQFSVCRSVLQMKQDEHELILAVPLDSYNTLFGDQIEQQTIQEEQLKMLIFHPLRNKLVKWIK